MLQVKIFFQGQSWGMHCVSGDFSKLPNTVLGTGAKLVNYCNKYGITVLNKDCLLPELASKLKR